MKYKVLKNQGNPGSKDITAFYGLNRTGDINDFQVSDMENMDCEDFPYLATRKSRVAVGEQTDMQMICSDTDIYDDYKVTGVTRDGAFVYRGTVYDLVDSGGNSVNLIGNVSMTENLGEYVLFPSGNVLSVVKTIDGVSVNFTDASLISRPYETRCLSGTITLNENHDVVGKYCKITKDEIRINYAPDRKYTYNFPAESLYEFVFNSLTVGQVFTLDLYCRNGTGKVEVDDSVKCEIPDDVYMTVEELYYTVGLGAGEEVKVQYGDADFNLDKLKSYYGSGHFPVISVKFSARKKITGELYDISEHFLFYRYGDDELFTGGEFPVGLAHIDWGWKQYYWNDFAINFVSNFSMFLFGASYGGRLFGCDNLGLAVYYSSASSNDFRMSASGGGAGYVSCADPGKWTAVCPYNDALYVFKRSGMYRIYSGDGLNFYMDKIADVGAVEKESVCVADNVMYFLSEEGLYRFTGAYPELLPDSLGRRYVGGTLGGNDRKVFASLRYQENGEEKNELVVWHADKQIFSRHDDFGAKQFLVAMGRVYALSHEGVVYQMEGDRTALSFSFQTKKYFFGFAKKAVNAARIYFEFEGGTDDETGEDMSFSVFVSYDGGEFVPCGRPIKDGRVRYVPVKFRKCDELALKIEGKGIFSIKGISFALYQGGDVKQNHMITGN